MKFLIIGGTRFVGRHLVEIGRARGHEFTLFNRGRSNPGLFTGMVEEIHGDRDGELAKLSGRTWDAVIDTCGYFPRLVRASAQFLADKVGHYTFISSISVYADFSQAGIDENSPVGTLADPTVETITGESYGPLKALCEQAVSELLPGRDLNLRPGLIVGPYDNSDRFSYWPHRVAAGGEILAPDQPNRLTQFIDCRDMVSWILDLIEAGQTGVYNATGPDYPLTIGQLLATCQTVSQSNATLTWLPDAFLQKKEVGPYVELPLWVPAEGNNGFDTVNVNKAIAAGLAFRPLLESVADTLAWLATRPESYQWRAGLKAAREAELLHAWHNENSQLS